MHTIRNTILMILFLFGAFAAVGFMLPGHWRVERSIEIQASPQIIYPYIANFKEGWPQWSTFAANDANVQWSYSQILAGEGASRMWLSETHGDGVQTIISAHPATGIVYSQETHYHGRFQQIGTLSLKIIPSGTLVVWTASGDVGKHPYQRFMLLFLDKVLGKTYQSSLENLKIKAQQAQQYESLKKDTAAYLVSP